MKNVNIDVIILSNTVSLKHANVLRETVTSVSNNPKNYKFNIIVVESNKNLINDTELKKITDNLNVKFITPKHNFHYNLFLNIALRECKGDFILVSNNDVIYSENWFHEMYKHFEKDKELMSACPIDRQWHRHSQQIFPGDKEIYYGYRTSYELTGWCFVFKKEVINKIGYFDEKFKFYYQDNDVSCLLNLFDIKHAIITTSHAHHLLSQSHDVVEDPEYKNMGAQRIPMMEKWGDIFYFEHGATQRKITPEKIQEIRYSRTYKRLSILICSLPDRVNYIKRLKKSLKNQLTPEVEVLVDFADRDEKTVGQKRNDLLKQSIGEYVCFIDDDDFVSEDYVRKIIKATDSKPDIVGFNTIITFDGVHPRKVNNSSANESWSHDIGKVPWDLTPHPIIYYRTPNHLTPVKRNLALDIGFPTINNEEDKYYSYGLMTKCKEEVFIDDYLYFYDCKSKDDIGELIDDSYEVLEEFYEKRSTLKNEINKVLKMNNKS